MGLPAHTDISGGLPRSGLAGFRLIDNELGRVKELIDKQLTVCPATRQLQRLLANFNSRSGKMLRPGLVLLAGSSVGKITNEHIHIAAIVEMIHNATLLHDDVIDEGRQRRGAPTINSLWGNESAVLLGDFLLSKVFRMCTDLEPRITRIISSAAARTCEGELRQTIQKHNWQLTESEYIDIITEKTATLFSSCCELGALLAGADESRARAFADFGLNLGIGFQITDDLLDIIGDEGTTGKTLGSDVDKSKLTLSVIHLLKAVEGREREMVKDKLSAAGESKFQRAELTEMLNRFGSLAYCRSLAQKFIDRSVQSLTGLREGDAKEALLGIAGFVAGRAG